MGKIKIHEIAKELGVNSKEVIAKANELGIQVTSHLSAVEEETANKIKNGFAKQAIKKESSPKEETLESKEEAIRKHAVLYIGTALTFVHILGIGLTGTSVNPARSIGPALFAISNTDGSSIAQVWVFIVGPLAGGFIASLVYSIIGKKTNN